MAGTYDHVVEEDGALAEPKTVQGMLECTSGDVYEAIEMMYGMIWVLATDLAEEIHGTHVDPKEMIEHAQETYKHGLALSPTSRFQEA
jgi:hypothetical protein